MTSDSRPLGSSEFVPGQAVELAGQVEYVAGSVVSRTIAKRPTGTITLFAFDRGQGLSEHSAPYDAFVQIVDGVATGGGVEHSHYGAAKAAIVAFTRTLARELGPDIRVNAVSPGVIDTPMVARNLRTKRDEVVNATPLKRLGRPSEVASVIGFLCSDAASFVTGEALLVTGGFWMGG